MTGLSKVDGIDLEGSAASALVPGRGVGQMNVVGVEQETCGLADRSHMLHRRAEKHSVAGTKTGPFWVDGPGSCWAHKMAAEAFCGSEGRHLIRLLD